jgi:hypothetical protein
LALCVCPVAGEPGWEAAELVLEGESMVAAEEGAGNNGCRRLGSSFRSAAASHRLRACSASVLSVTIPPYELEMERVSIGISQPRRALLAACASIVAASA